MQNNSFNRLFDWCIEVLNFLYDELDGLSMIQQMIDVTQSVYQKQDKPGLRAIEHELKDYINDLTSDQQDRLQALLNAKDLSLKTPGQSSKSIEQILKAGRISTTAEYRVVIEATNDVESVGIDSAHRSLLNKLIQEFEVANEGSSNSE